MAIFYHMMIRIHKFHDFSQDIKNTIDQIDANDEKLDHLCFSQINEPLLDNRFFEVAEYAKKSGFKIDKFLRNELFISLIS